jgi:hypothetical protein
MAKALSAEINDVVVKYTERKLRKDGTLDVAVMATNTLHSPMQRDRLRGSLRRTRGQAAYVS